MRIGQKYELPIIHIMHDIGGFLWHTDMNYTATQVMEVNAVIFP